MGIKIVRTPSETPNITNVDDIIPFRYAYGNQNGYVIGRGSELSGSYESGEFTVGSGRAVIQGVEVDIDANGISTTLDTASETRYFKIYLKVNLANDVAVLESYYSTVSYDEITDPTSSDLISGGDAYLLLYTLQLSGTTQAEKNKVVKSIEYINPNIAVMKTDFSENNASQFGDYIVSKKKLLWSGDFNFGETEKTLTGLTANDVLSKKIELEFSQTAGMYNGYVHGLRLSVRFIGISRQFFNYIFFTGDGTSNAHLNQLKAFISIQPSSNEISFNSETLSFSLTQSSWRSAPETKFKIYKIYEIIE